MGIKKNYTYNLIYQVFVMILPIITIPYVSRILGADGLGIYSFTSSVISYFVLFGGLGISIYARREIAYARDNKEKLSRTFCGICVLQFISLIIILLVFATFLLISDSANKLLYILQVFSIISYGVDISWFYIGIEQFKNIVKRNIIIKSITLILIFVMVRKENDLQIYTVIMSLSTFLGQIILWKDVRKYIKVTNIFDVSKNDIIRHLKGSIGLFSSVLAINLYLVIDKTLIGIFSSYSEVAMYDNAQKIIRISFTIITAFVSVMVPRISNLYIKDELEKIHDYLLKSLKFVSFLSIGMTCGLISIADKFVPWFFGNDFSKVSIIMGISSLVIPFIAWREVIGNQLLIPTNKNREYTISIIVGLIINIILNVILIGKYNSIGAAVATIVSEFFIVVMQICIVNKYINIKENLIWIFKYLLAGVIMISIVRIVSYSMSSNIFSTVKQILVGLLVYIIVLYIMKDQVITDGIINIRDFIKKKKLK